MFFKVSLLVYIVFITLSADAQYINKILDYSAPNGSPSPYSLVENDGNYFAPLLIFDENNVLTSSILSISEDFELQTSIQFDSFSVAGLSITIFEDNIYLFGKNRYKNSEYEHVVLNKDLSVLINAIFETPGEYSFPGYCIMLDSSFYTSYFVEFADGSIRQEGITKFNASSEIVWQKTYNSTIERSYPWKMISSTDNSILVSSSIHYFDDWGGYPQLKKIDQEGIVKWSVEGTERVLNGAVPVWVTQLSNGTILQSYKVNAISSEWNDEPIRLIWYNDEGDIINSKTIYYPKTDELHFSNIKSGRGEYFYTYGNYMKGVSGSDDLYYAIITKYSNNGNLIWTHKYQNPNFEGSNAPHNITDILEKDNGDIVTLGTVKRLGEEAKVWMMNLDEWGCLNSNDCDEVVITDVINNIHQKIAISPNPSNGILNFVGISMNIKHVEVLNTQGQYIGKVLPIDNTLDLSHLSNGIYFLNFKSIHNSGTTVRIVILK